MEIARQFGLEPVLLAAQIVNFLVILFLLKRYLYKPVLSMLEKRKHEIKQGLADAQKAQELLEKTQEEERKILKNAQAQAKKILDEAKDQAQALAKETETQVKKQTETMIKEAKAHIAQEAAETENRIMKNVTKISIQILEKSLSGMVGGKAQQEILEKTLKDLEKKPN